MRVKCNYTSMTEHAIKVAFLYPVFVRTPDFSKFRVKRDWSHGLKFHSEVLPVLAALTVVIMTRAPGEPSLGEPWVGRAGCRRSVAWSEAWTFGVGIRLRTGTAGTHCYPTDGAGLMVLIASQGSSRKKRVLRAATVFECLLCARRCSKQSMSSWYLILSTNYKVGAISGLTLQVTDARLGCQDLA